MNTVLERAAPVGALQLAHGMDGGITATRDGVSAVVSVRQAFPWTEPTRFLSLRDHEEKEFALVDDVRALDRHSRQVLEAAQALAGFVLRVTQVLEVEDEIEIRCWRVETEQGPRSFQTRLDDWPRGLPDGSLLVRDVAGDLYHVAQPDQLDEESRRLIWAFVD